MINQNFTQTSDQQNIIKKETSFPSTFNSSVDFNQIKKAKDILKDVEARKQLHYNSNYDKSTASLNNTNVEKTLTKPLTSVINKNIDSNLEDTLKNNIFEKKLQTKSSTNLWKLSFWLLVILVLSYKLVIFSFNQETNKWPYQVLPGQAAVLYDELEGQIHYNLPTGTFFTWPWQKVYQIPTTPVSYAITDQLVYSKDLRAIEMNSQIILIIHQEDIVNIFQEYGLTSMPDLWQSFLKSHTQEVIKDVLRLYTYQGVVQNQTEIKKRILRNLSTKIQKYHVEVVDIYLDPRFNTNS